MANTRKKASPQEPTQEEISIALCMKQEHDARAAHEATCIEIMDDAIARCAALGFDVLIETHVRGDRVIKRGLVVVPRG